MAQLIFLSTSSTFYFIIPTLFSLVTTIFIDSKPKSKPKPQPKIELIKLECNQTMHMLSDQKITLIFANYTIYSRNDKFCKWNFIGSEQCTPMITCNTTHLIKDCDQEYLEIADGSTGYMKICGPKPPSQIVNISATEGLRDLFVHFKVLKGVKDKRNILFSCTAQCSKKLWRRPLRNNFTSKINPKCFCGTKPNEDRISGGETAKKFEYPWLIAIVETNTRQPFCGGSIINNRFILTAGHCIKSKFTDPQNSQVIVNGHELDESPNRRLAVGMPVIPKIYDLQQLEQLDKGNKSRRYNIEEIIVHPLYGGEEHEFDFDVALLKLQQDIDLMPKVKNIYKTVESMETYLQQPRAVCLPELGSYLKHYADKKAVVAGWGFLSENASGTMEMLQKLEVKIWTPVACLKLYEEQVNKRMVCAGHPKGGGEACLGDSGGPLIVEDKPKVWTQVGVVSFGPDCGEGEDPGIYFRLTEVVQWIHYNSNFNGGRRDDDKSDGSGMAWCVTP